MTDESKSDTEPWIEKKAVKYAYAYDKGGKLSRYFGVNGIPHAVLLDANGKVVWAGHPGNLEPATIEKALHGALSQPMWEWPASAKAVKTAVQKRLWADAITAASKLSEADGGPVITEALKQLVAGRVSAMKLALESGDLLSAQDSANQLVKSLGTLPEKADVDTVLAALKANKEAPRLIKAQQQIRAIRESDLAKRKVFDAAVQDLKKLAKDFSGTYPGKEASDLLDELATKKRGG